MDTVYPSLRGQKSPWVGDSARKDYRVIENILRNTGFTNISCIALKDLTTGWITKPGMVQSVTIDGKAVVTGKKYHRDVPVTISYHSFNHSSGN